MKDNDRRRRDLKRTAIGALRCFGIGIGILWFASPMAAAIPNPLPNIPNKVLPGKSATLVDGRNAVIGGQSGIDFSLLNVLDFKVGGGQTPTEQIEFVYGDRTGRALSGPPGYFHVTLDRSGRRLIVDLAQVTKTAVDPQHLSAILAKSRLVASSEMTMDPLDGSTNITLTMKAPVHPLISVRSDKSSRLVIQLRSASAGSGNAL